MRVASKPCTPAILACAAVLAGAIPCAAEDRIDLDTAIRSAVERNRELVRSALGVRKGELNITDARTAFGVSVLPDGSASGQSDQDEWQYGLLAQKKTTWGTEMSVRGNLREVSVNDAPDYKRGLIRVEISQPLFKDFGRLVHTEFLKQANEALLRERRNWEQQKAQLVVQVVKSFETIIQLEARIRSDEAMHARTEKLYALTKAREKQGRTTRVDSLRVELQRGEAQARLENNREELFSARREFAELIGMEPDAEFVLEPPPLLEIPLPAAEEAVRLALGNRLDYAQVLQDRRTSQRAVRIARRGLYPDLNLTARHDTFGEGATSSDATAFDEDDWFVGVTASTDLNQRKARTAWEQALVDAQGADQAVDIRRLSIAREVQQALSAYRRTHGDLERAARNGELAARRAELARNLFRIGRMDSFSVTDAESALVQAEGDVLGARAAASVSGYELLRSLGTLVESPEALKPPAEKGL